MRSLGIGLEMGKNQHQIKTKHGGKLKTRISRKHTNFAEHNVSQKCEICEEIFTISYCIKQKAWRSISVKIILNPED